METVVIILAVIGTIITVFGTLRESAQIVGVGASLIGLAVILPLVLR